ncbi:MAG: hypothetical protein K2X82_15290 [Gemmataceae bacterium]|nr:hypothetical protein [Gemmataceae bacterium]
MKLFERDGVRFQYPANWSAEAGDDPDAGDGGWSVTVQSPESAFLFVSVRPDADTPADLADQALAALKAEYKELDAENAVETIGGTAAIGHDIDFLTVDTSVVCRTRCLDTTAGPLLVLAQVGEYDREQHDPVLRAIVASLTIDQE